MFPIFRSEVAVKVLHKQKLRLHEVEDFINEIEIMAFLFAFILSSLMDTRRMHHPKVQSVLGASLSPFMILTDLKAGPSRHSHCLFIYLFCDQETFMTFFCEVQGRTFPKIHC